MWNLNLILFELDDDLLGPERNDIARNNLFSFLRSHFSIDANLALSDHRFRLATTSNHALKLQNLVQFDRLFCDDNLSHESVVRPNV